MRQIRQPLCILHSALCIALVSASAYAGLPPGHLRLTSIAATGTQYIKTGMKPTSSTTVEMDFNTGPYANDTTFFGQAWNTSQFLFIKQSNAYKFYGSGGQVSALNNNADAHLSITSDNKFILDYGETAVTTSVSRAASANAFNIFADCNGAHKGSWTLYSMQISTGGVQVRDFVPAKRLADGVGGLVDLVEGKFYENADTGSFTMGEVVSEPDRFDITASPDGLGLPSPSYGVTNGLAAGDSFTVSCGMTPAADTAGTRQYSCTGWKLYDATNAVVSTGSETSFTYVHPTPAEYRRLEWQWEVTAFRGTIAPGHGGAVSPSGTGWFAVGTPVTVTATPNAGSGFKRWAGTLPAGLSASSASTTFTPTAPFSMTAVFETVGYGGFVFFNEKMSSYWHTATNCVIALPIEFPAGASAATLSVTGSVYSAQYAIPVGTEQYTLSLPVATSPSTENVYDLTLAFNDAGSTMRTAKLGLIEGYDTTTAGWTRYLTPMTQHKWGRVRGRVVIPIPYGSEPLAIGGATVDTGLDGAQGWYPLLLRGGQSAALTLDNGAGATLFRPPEQTTVILR